MSSEMKWRMQQAHDKRMKELEDRARTLRTKAGQSEFNPKNKAAMIKKADNVEMQKLKVMEIHAANLARIKRLQA